MKFSTKLEIFNFISSVSDWSAFRAPVARAAQRAEMKDPRGRLRSFAGCPPASSCPSGSWWWTQPGGGGPPRSRRPRSSPRGRVAAQGSGARRRLSWSTGRPDEGVGCREKGSESTSLARVLATRIDKKSKMEKLLKVFFAFQFSLNFRISYFWLLKTLCRIQNTWCCTLKCLKWTSRNSH